MDKVTRKLQANYAPILVLLLIAASFFIGRLSAQVDYLKGGLVANQPSKADTAQPAAAQPSAANLSMDVIKGLFKKDVIKFGDANRKVTFVDVSDPSCPYCHIAGGKNSKLNNNDSRFKLVKDGGTYQAPVEEMRKLLDAGKASYIWVYSVGHGNGEMGAKALFCAQEKGKFWQTHDMLYSAEGYDMLNNTVKNDKAQAGTLANFLSKVVDSRFMKDCLSGNKYDNRITADMALGRELGANGTPYFLVNASPFNGAYNYTDMKATVDGFLK